MGYYHDVCKLAVLSGLEIDKAKRSYDNVNVGKELSALRKKYNRPAPMFFKEIDERDKENEYEFYDTAMDYIYQAVKKFNFQKGKKKRVNYTPISWTIIDKTLRIMLLIIGIEIKSSRFAMSVRQRLAVCIWSFV